LANDSDFGLGGPVFTSDTGMMFINLPTWTTAELPFGRIKNSGYGRWCGSLRSTQRRSIAADSACAAPCVVWGSRATFFFQGFSRQMA
jgi:acyl-CoA reductase-like NAD-dependent aldehyde dehydrogenase